MGMWDQVFMGNQRPSPNIGLALIPFIGPALAEALRRKQQASNEQQWTQENAAFYPDKDYSPDTLSGRIAQRMLQRTGGETTIPGIMAATAFQRQAQNPENMGNMGNIAMRAASDLAQTRPDLAVTMAQVAHKSLQTPWKLSEGGADVENFKLPNGKIVAVSAPEAKQALINAGAVKAGVASAEEQVPWTLQSGGQLGMVNQGALGNYAVQYNDDGTIRDIKGMGGMNVSVSSNVVTPTDVSGAVTGLIGNIGTTKQGIETIDSLAKILKANPEGGVSGWSGYVTDAISNVFNVAQFASKSDIQILSKYSKALLAYAGKFFPTADRAKAESMINDLGYAVARMNNMGTSGGGRGITDADMQYALQQLGAMSKVSDFLGVLNYQRNKMIGNLKLNFAGTQTILKLAGKDPKMLDDLPFYKDAIAPPADDRGDITRFYTPQSK